LRAAPAHLESRLRFWDFTVGQIAAAFVGIMLGVVWAKFVSPFHGIWAAMSGAYIAALPVIPVFVASQTEFDLWGLVMGVARWRRLEGRYLPGAGETASGYVLLGEHDQRGPTESGESLELELQTLWEHDRRIAPAPLRDPRPEAIPRLAWMNNGKETP
jgi:hypothetical protein